MGTRAGLDAGGLPKDPKDLVDFRIPWEEWLTMHNHLSNNAPNRPHVDSRAVMT